MNLYEGVNELLLTIGEVPITDNTQAVEAESSSDVGIARDTILKLSKAMQLEGYWFNKETNYPLVPNINNKIPISDTILSIVDTNYLIKDHKLYDVNKRTYDFDKTVSTTIIFLIVFDDLPQVMADTIVREAKVEFYNNTFGDTEELKILMQNAQRAQISLQKAQTKHRRSNLISGSRIINRRQNPRGLQ